MTVLPQSRDVLKLADYMSSVQNFKKIASQPRTIYCHMGATICDTILQAGLNYRTVVAPRISQLLNRWPTARTSTAFLFNLRRYDLYSVLSWTDDEKPRRIVELAEFLVEQDLETECDVADWLSTESHVDSLRQLRGFGPKTTDYLKMMVGVSAIPVDRHVRSFLGKAGIKPKSYSDTQAIFAGAADLLALNRSSLDYAVWRIESNQLKRAA
jgi:hypothetical protein